MRCPACAFHFFFNVAAAAGAFILIDRKLLLCVRGKEPGLGQLDVPGGFLEFEESVEEGLRREIKEELGISVGPLVYLTSAPNSYCYDGIEYHTSDVFFMAAAESKAEIRAQDDVSGYYLLEPLCVDPDRFAFASTRRGYLEFCARFREGQVEAVENP